PHMGWLQSAFQRCSARDAVRYHGVLRREDVARQFQNAHIMLLPSRFEGLPWALLEGMACGCVPLVSNIKGGTDLVVRQGETGNLCGVGRTSQFVKCLLAL